MCYADNNIVDLGICTFKTNVISQSNWYMPIVPATLEDVLAQELEITLGNRLKAHIKKKRKEKC